MMTNKPLMIGQNKGVNAQDCQGLSAMHMAVGTENLKMVKLLDGYGGDALLTNGQGQCSVDLAIQIKNSSIIEYFSKKTEYREYMDRILSIELPDDTPQEHKT